MRHFSLGLLVFVWAMAPSHAIAEWESVIGVQAHAGDVTYEQSRTGADMNQPLMTMSSEREEDGAGAGLYFQSNYVFDGNLVLGSELSIAIGEYDNDIRVAPIDVLVRIGYDIGGTLRLRPFVAFGGSAMITDSEFNIEDDYIFGFKAGAGVNVILGFIVLDIGYYYAYYADKDLDNISPGITRAEANISQNVGRVSVGLRF